MRDGSLAKSGNISEIALASDFHKNWLTKIIVNKAVKQFCIEPGKIKIYKIWTHKSQRPFYRAKIYSVKIREMISKFYNPGSQQNWETPKTIKTAPFYIKKLT